MLDLIDHKTSKVIWRGWAEGEVNNPEKAINELPKVMSNIFKNYPGNCCLSAQLLYTCEC